MVNQLVRPRQFPMERPTTTAPEEIELVYPAIDDTQPAPQDVVDKAFADFSATAEKEVIRALGCKQADSIVYTGRGKEPRFKKKPLAPKCVGEVGSEGVAGAWQWLGEQMAWLGVLCGKAADEGATTLTEAKASKKFGKQASVVCNKLANADNIFLKDLGGKGDSNDGVVSRLVGKRGWRGKSRRALPPHESCERRGGEIGEQRRPGKGEVAERKARPQVPRQQRLATLNLQMEGSVGATTRLHFKSVLAS